MIKVNCSPILVLYGFCLFSRSESEGKTRMEPILLFYCLVLSQIEPQLPVGVTLTA